MEKYLNIFSKSHIVLKVCFKSVYKSYKTTYENEKNISFFKSKSTYIICLLKQNYLKFCTNLQTNFLQCTVSRVKLDEWHSSGRPPPAALFEKDGMSSLIKRGRESIK